MSDGKRVNVTITLPAELATVVRKWKGYIAISEVCEAGLRVALAGIPEKVRHEVSALEEQLRK